MASIYTFCKEPGSKALITYSNQTVLLRQKLIEKWQNFFINNNFLNTQIIQGTGLVPYSLLKKTGHVAAFEDNANELFKVDNNLALRPETCVSIFAYYLATYGTRLKNTCIIQAGRSFRNERTTRGCTRLTEFTQLEVEYFTKPQDPTTSLQIQGQSYKVSETFSNVYSKACEFFKELGIVVIPQVVTARAFYSRFTIDLMIKDGESLLEVACINDRGYTDISRHVLTTEISIGLDRLVYFIENENRN